MGEWRQSTWGDEISLEYGKAIRGYQDASGPYRVFGANGTVGRTDKPLVPGPGIILGRKGAYRGVHFSKEAFFVIDTAYYVKLKSDDLDMRWIYYAMIHHRLGEIDDGSPIPSTPRAAVYPCKLDVPPLSEQRAIAAVLSALDDKIELNRRMNATLEAMARALFRDWFVDFGPTRARMEGRPPYLAPELWSLFPDRLDDQGKPEGWEVSEIGKETTAVGGSTPSTKEPSYWGGDINWATPKDLSTLKAPVLLETSRTITEAGLEKISSGLLPEGTVLLSSRAPIGYVAIAAVPVAVNQGFIALKCGRRLSKEFVWQWLHAFMEDIKGKANGSTFQEISKKNFRPIPVVVPSEEVLQAFDAIVSPALERIIANERESRTLARTRDLLLPRLMSGELRVAEAGKIVEGEV